MELCEIGVAVIGTGFMGWVHVEALRRAGVNVVGICGSSPKKSAAAAHRLGINKGYDRFEQAIGDPEVDAVHIGTPNRHHFEMASLSLQAGKHVLCEKPLAMSASESASLVDLSRQCPQQATAVNYNIRFYPLCVEARERVSSGELGDIFHVTGSYVQDWLLWPTDYNWRVLAEEGGELRAIADIGTHWLDLIQNVTGLEVQEVMADLQTVHRQRLRPLGELETFQRGPLHREEVESLQIHTEDAGNILLRFRSGARGVLNVSQVTAGRKNCLRFEIAGSKRALCWNSESPNELWIGHRDRPNQCLTRDPALMSDAAGIVADYPGGHNEGYADSFKHCFRSFYTYIAAGDFQADASFPTFADGHREVVLCEAILKSHRSRQWVKVNGE
jgi:predicted dehydrogenase